MSVRILSTAHYCVFAIAFASAYLSFAQSTSASLANYIYTTPAGWKSTQYADGIVLQPAVLNNGESCLMTMWPMRPAGSNLAGDADRIFREVFATYEPRFRGSDGMPIPETVVHGVSGQGWDYLILKRGIGKPSVPAGRWESLLGFVFVARLDQQLAVVSGLSKVPLVSTCFGELARNVWPEFFYSLSFKNWSFRDTADSARKRLAGAWTIATASVADQITFAANGRYDSAAAAQQYSRISNSEMLTTTQAYFGNGGYTLAGNSITLQPDDPNRRVEKGFFRLEDESNDGGRTWKQFLYLLRTSLVDGKPYEVRYKSQ